MAIRTLHHRNHPAAEFTINHHSHHSRHHTPVMVEVPSYFLVVIRFWVVVFTIIQARRMGLLLRADYCRHYQVGGPYQLACPLLLKFRPDDLSFTLANPHEMVYHPEHFSIAFTYADWTSKPRFRHRYPQFCAFHLHHHLLHFNHPCSYWPTTEVLQEVSTLASTEASVSLGHLQFQCHHHHLDCHHQSS